MNPYLICYGSRKFDARFVYVSRSVSRPRGSTLGVENRIDTFLLIPQLIAAVGVIQAHPQVWIDVDFILLFHGASSYMDWVTMGEPSVVEKTNKIITDSSSRQRDIL